MGELNLRLAHPGDVAEQKEDPGLLYPQTTLAVGALRVQGPRPSRASEDVVLPAILQAL